jgi:hypothetical protein
MAARPPTQITVKRKRGDDDSNPVDFLRPCLSLSLVV